MKCKIKKLKRERVEVGLNCTKFLNCDDVGRFLSAIVLKSLKMRFGRLIGFRQSKRLLDYPISIFQSSLCAHEKREESFAGMCL